jgi:hypothetical protein
MKYKGDVEAEFFFVSVCALDPENFFWMYKLLFK